MKQVTETFCFVAGKSGGHIIPAIALIEQIKLNNQTARIVFFSTSNALDAQLLGMSSLIQRHIKLNVDTRKKTVQNLPIVLFNFLSAFVRSFFILRTEKPQKIISMGGFVSIPVCIAAKLLGIPIELYELNAQPGKAVSFLQRMATKIHICFEDSRNYFTKKECALSEYPLRKNFLENSSNKNDLHSKLGFYRQKKTILIIGGSQGSQFINESIKSWLENHPEMSEKIQLIHQSGKHMLHNLQHFYATLKIPAYVFEFDPEIHNYYSIADIVICRSGAGTLFELAHLEKKCITIPLEIKHNNHQLYNAYAITKKFPHLFYTLRQRDINLLHGVICQQIK